MRIYVLVALALVFGASEALAQSRPGGGGSAGSSSFGSGSGLSGGGAGGAAFGQTGSGFNPSAGNITRQPGQFVGSSADNASRFVGSSQSGGQQQGSSGSRGSGSGRGSSRGGSRGGGNQRDEVRMRVSLGFHPSISRVNTGAKLARRMEKSSWITARSPIEVQIDPEGTATLSGSVATDHDRVLAQRLTMLEAGIWRVNNELTVVPLEQTPASPEAPPTQPLPPSESSPTSSS